MKKITYDTKKYPFSGIISEWLDIDDLSKLHEIREYERFIRENDQSSMWHKKFYELIREDEAFNDNYIPFLRDIIKPRFNEEIVYQKIPTFRVHLPNNISVGEYHKDKNYRDEVWAEKVKETNYYLPFTKAYEGNTIWAESEEDKGDFKPMNCEYGECYEWDASNLMHGNKDNSTPDTRVSVDFRIIPKSRYRDSGQKTINTNTEFKIGSYYSVL